MRAVRFGNVSLVYRNTEELQREVLGGTDCVLRWGDENTDHSIEPTAREGARAAPSMTFEEFLRESAALIAERQERGE